MKDPSGIVEVFVLVVVYFIASFVTKDEYIRYIGLLKTSSR